MSQSGDRSPATAEADRRGREILELVPPAENGFPTSTLGKPADDRPAEDREEMIIRQRARRQGLALMLVSALCSLIALYAAWLIFSNLF